MAKKIKPVNILPFRLHNIEDFVHQTHPVYMPDTPAYDSYWDKQLEFNIQGLWGHDYDKKKDIGGYRYMPKNLHFYINATQIKIQGDRGQEVEGPPLLRDIEWSMGYDLAACDGFAGFESSPFTGFRPVLKTQLNLELSETEKYMLDQYGDFIRDKYGRLKPYKDPLDILYDTYNEPLGNPLYFNERKNGQILSTRGCGKSFSAVNMLALYGFIFNGAQSVEEYYSKKTSITTVVGSYESKKSEELLSKMEISHKYIKEVLGAYTYGPDDVQNGVFWHPYSGSTAVGGALRKMVKSKSGMGSEGIDNKIPHVTWKVDASAAVGHRANILVEEAALMTNFFAVHGENSAVQGRDWKTFFSWYIGTGGDVTAIKAMSSAFWNPDAFDILSHPDIFTGTNKRIATFYPAYVRKNIFKDEMGNSDVERGFRDEMYERDRRKHRMEAYTRYCISYPIVPREMFQQAESGYFPLNLVEDGLDNIEADPPKKSVGFYMSNPAGKPIWNEDVAGRLTPIESIVVEDELMDKRGAVVIYEHPVEPRPARTLINPLYIVFYDQVMKKGQDGPSYCVAFVFKTWDVYNSARVQFNIVAEWVGRMDTTDGNHKIVMDMADAYDAYVFPETNLEDFERYATQVNKYHWLHPMPGEIVDGIVKKGKHYEIGLKIVPGMIPTLRTYLSEVLSTVTRVKQEINGDTYTVKEIRMAQEMKSKRGLEEIQAYNETDNFDYVSAMLLLGAWAKATVLKAEYKSKDDSISRAEQEYREQVMNKRPKPSLNQSSQNSAFNY